MGLPLEDYRGFFTQNPEIDQSSHDSAAEPKPHRTQCLKDIAETAKAAWTSSRDDASDDMAALAEIVADACRQRKIPLHAAANSSLPPHHMNFLPDLHREKSTASWRLPVGDSGLLTFFLTTVLPSPDLSTSLQKQSLRLIGNACAQCGKSTLFPF